MKKILVIPFSICLFSCRSHVPKPAKPVITQIQSHTCDTLEGTYTGDFDNSTIWIALTHITGSHAMGYNLVKGLRRNMSGKMMSEKNGYSFLLNEPGDDPNDGKFIFSIDTATFVLTGTWTPLNNSKLAPKQFTLKKIVDSLKGEMDDYQYWSDSIGSFTFDPEGKCTYEFYPTVNGKPAEQYVHVIGTWAIKNGTYIVDWQPNTTFPNRRSIFKIDSQKTGPDEFYYRTLHLGNRILEQNEY